MTHHRPFQKYSEKVNFELNFENELTRGNKKGSIPVRS